MHIKLQVSYILYSRWRRKGKDRGQATCTYNKCIWAVKVYVHVFLTLALDGVKHLCPNHFTSGKSGPDTHCKRAENNFLSVLEIRPRSHYTNGQKTIISKRNDILYLPALLATCHRITLYSHQLMVTAATHSAVTKVTPTNNFNNSLPQAFLLALDICSWCQSLCLWSGCIEDSTDFRNLVSSILQLSSYQLCSLADSIRTILK